MFIRYSVIGLMLTASLAVSASPATDSVKVVKGQVSDYFIPVTTTRVLDGTVVDQSGEPLEGATVMFFASALHCNTDASGRFALTAAPNDTLLYVYSPGMEFATMTVRPGDPSPVIRMQPSATKPHNVRRKAQATKWYDPAQYAPTTFCNPTNISYNFEPFNRNVDNGTFRSSADPMGLLYGDEVFLFSTNQDGFHSSKDLSRWEFQRASFKRRPTDDDQCAPAAFVSGDTLFYTGSTYEGLPVWYTTNPKGGKWRRAVDRNTLPSWDPWLFLDDDGRLYLYYGSSNEYPLKGVELSREDFSPISKIYDLIALHPQEHGWERFGMNNDDEVTLAPFMEGGAMNKYNGKYYLQYGAPGTEFKVYADGVYVSDNPLGPFVYQRHNPMSYKPGGYVRGAGHGGTFTDANGNYWHTATCMLSLKYKFERRIGIYPAGFDEDGVMYCSTALGDYPTLNATQNISDPTARFAGWMLLSYGKPATASATADGFDVAAITDEDMRTYWAAPDAAEGRWVSVDLGEPMEVRAIQVNYYDHNATQCDRADDLYHQYRIYASDDGADWTLVVDKSDSDEDTPHDYVELREPLQTRYVKLENLHMPSGDFALSALRIFGLADKPAPAEVKGFKADRDAADRRNAMLTWEPSEGAYGYNIYFGTEPDKLYNAITVLGECQYDLRGLDRDTEYYFSIESFNEGGRSRMALY